MAINQSIQRKVQAEIDSIFEKNDAQITEDSLAKMEVRFYNQIENLFYSIEYFLVLGACVIRMPQAS